MKRLMFLAVVVFGAATVVLAWQYSVQNTWDGSQWVDASTSFTPPGTTVYVKMTAPDFTGYEDCTQDPAVYCTQYDAIAKLTQGTTAIKASRRNGACDKKFGTVSTSQQATLTASLFWICDDFPGCGQQSSWGPVTAAAGNPITDCAGSGPSRD